MVFFLQIATALTETLTLLVLSLFAMSIASPEAAMNHFLVRPVLDAIPPLAEFCSTPRRMVGFTSSFMVFFVCLKGLLSGFTNYQGIFFSEKVAYFIGREASKQYLSKSYYWHISADSQKVIHKIIDRSALSTLTIQLLSLYSNIICSIFLFISLFIAEPKMTLVVILCFSGSSLSLYTLLRRSLDKAGQVVSTTAIEENMTMTTMSKGIREIITYHQQKTALKKMMTAVEKGLPAKTFLFFSSSLPALVMECVGFSTIGGVVIYMLGQHIPMEEIVATASILMLTAWRILPIVTRSLAYSVSIRGFKARALLSLDLLETFIATEIEPPIDPEPNFEIKKSLALKNASFHYPGTDHDSVSKVSLTIYKGQNIGLIGPSGAGKSTLALLLSALVSPTEGLFEVDGQVLTSVAKASYLLKLGYVPQNPLLMEGTLADNVAFSQWGLEYDRDKVMESCRLAALDFVVKDPSYLDLPLAGSSGRTLSGGEAQRVAIARALFSDPQIIIFDEATSALDQANEGTIRNTISRIKGQMTTIIIAHRLSTVEDCDLIFWVDSGQLKKCGPPSEIIPLYEASLTPDEINPDDPVTELPVPAQELSGQTLVS
jgi:ABC-type multidrug transport system fused ATPase/permease subunit